MLTRESNCHHTPLTNHSPRCMRSQQWPTCTYSLKCYQSRVTATTTMWCICNRMKDRYGLSQLQPPRHLRSIRTTLTLSEKGCNASLTRFVQQTSLASKTEASKFGISDGTMVIHILYEHRPHACDTARVNGLILT